MRSFALFLFGVILGLVVVAGYVYSKAAGYMLEERASPVGLEETVTRISQAAVAEGWVVQSVLPLEKSIEKNGGGIVLPIRLVNLCQAQHAARMMREDDLRRLSVFMPCTISVYEKSDGKTYFAAMNASLLGRLYGGIVAEVMGEEVAGAQTKFMDAVALPTPADAPADKPTDEPAEEAPEAPSGS